MQIVIFTYHMPWDAWDDYGRGGHWPIIDFGIPWYFWSSLVLCWYTYHCFKDGEFEFPWSTEKSLGRFIRNSIWNTIHSAALSAILGYMIVALISIVYVLLVGSIRLISSLF